MAKKHGELPPEIKAAILYSMARRAIEGDTKAAKVVLDEQQKEPQAEPVKIIVDV